MFAFCLLHVVSRPHYVEDALHMRSLSVTAGCGGCGVVLAVIVVVIVVSDVVVVVV